MSENQHCDTKLMEFNVIPARFTRFLTGGGLTKGQTKGNRPTQFDLAAIHQ
jgi:hypothetical protein